MFRLSREYREGYWTIYFLQGFEVVPMNLEKPALLDPLLPDQLLFLEYQHLPTPPEQDMAMDNSPDAPISSPSSRRVSKRVSPSEKPIKSRQMGQEQPKELNHGHWLPEENQRYHWFLEIHYQHFVNSHMRRTDKIFKTMEIFIGTRQAEQCRSHHQKMEKKYINFTNILVHFREQNYHTISPAPMQADLEREQIDFPDGLANEQELNTYRQMQEQARKKFGRRRMWKRNAPERQPTPSTIPPQMPSQSPALDNQPEERQQRYQREVDERQKEEGGNAINMFDQFQHNIGELSVFNEKEDVSCLFHSFFH